MLAYIAYIGAHCLIVILLAAIIWLDYLEEA